MRKKKKNFKKIKVRVKKNPTCDLSEENYIKFLWDLTLVSMALKCYDAKSSRAYLQSTGEEYSEPVYIHGHGESFTDGHGSKVIER